MALLNFDASSVKPMEALEVLPAGWYTANMTASEMKPTTAGDGSYLNCEFTILAPADFAGRKVFTRLNLQNKNPAAQEIGYRTLSAVCHAANLIQIQDSAQLHNIPMQIKLKLRAAGKGADGNEYEASNEISGYKAVGAPVSAQPATPAAPAPGGWQPPAAPPVAPPAGQPQAPASAPAWAAAPVPQVAPAEAAPQTPPAVPAAPIAQTPPWAKPAA